MHLIIKRNALKSLRELLRYTQFSRVVPKCHLNQPSHVLHIFQLNVNRAHTVELRALAEAMLGEVFDSMLREIQARMRMLCWSLDILACAANIMN
jgi:hypothetical protein